LSLIVWSGHSCPLAFDFGFDFDRQGHGFTGRGKTTLLATAAPSAAKAGVEDKRVIAALKRCATQNRGHNRVFPQALQPCSKAIAGHSGFSP